jgi:hypothetical protein
MYAFTFTNKSLFPNVTFLFPVQTVDAIMTEFVLLSGANF